MCDAKTEAGLPQDRWGPSANWLVRTHRHHTIYLILRNNTIFVCTVMSIKLRVSHTFKTAFSFLFFSSPKNLLLRSPGLSIAPSTLFECFSNARTFCLCHTPKPPSHLLPPRLSPVLYLYLSLVREHLHLVNLKRERQARNMYTPAHFSFCYYRYLE